MNQPQAGLTISELRQVCAVLLDEAERRHGADFDLTDTDHDYYWHLDVEAAFNMTDCPDSRVDCGQISDDTTEVASLLQRGGPVALWHDLEHVVGLLRLLAFLDRTDTHG